MISIVSLFALPLTWRKQVLDSDAFLQQCVSLQCLPLQLTCHVKHLAWGLKWKNSKQAITIAL